MSDLPGYDVWKTRTPEDDDPELIQSMCVHCGQELDGACRPKLPCRTCDPNESGTGPDMRGRCRDCGRLGELTGHMTCEYPRDRY